MKAISLDIKTANGSYSLKLDDTTKEFVGKLLDYLDVGNDTTDLEFTSEAESIVKERLAAYKAGKAKLYTYDEVKEMLSKKF